MIAGRNRAAGQFGHRLQRRYAGQLAGEEPGSAARAELHPLSEQQEQTEPGTIRRVVGIAAGA
jgi:hypothetical protein